MDYSTLEKMSATDYLYPTKFVTEYDRIRPEHANEQYQSGLATGRLWDYVSLSCRGVWGAGIWSGLSHVTSYEGIGYHANTADLLRGFLDSQKPIRVTRWNDECRATNTWIKPLLPIGTRITYLKDGSEGIVTAISNPADEFPSVEIHWWKMKLDAWMPADQLARGMKMVEYDLIYPKQRSPVLDTQGA